MNLAHFERIFTLFFFCFFLAVNKLITEKTQNIFSLMAGHSGFIKYSLNKQYQINGIVFSKPYRGKHIIMSLSTK